MEKSIQGQVGPGQLGQGVSQVGVAERGPQKDFGLSAPSLPTELRIVVVPNGFVIIDSAAALRHLEATTWRVARSAQELAEIVGEWGARHRLIR